MSNQAESISNNSDMTIDLKNNYEINVNIVNYFSPDYLRATNEKALIMVKDLYSAYSIILRKSVSIVNSVNFELVNEIRNIPDNFPIDDPEKIVLYQNMKVNYMLIYSEKIFAIFNLNLKDYNNYLIFQISELEDDERIISIKPLNNDLKLPYFIVVTSNNKILILSLINLNPQSNFLNDTYFETSKLNENTGIFKKLTSYLLPSKISQIDSDKVFVLNPSENGVLYKNNTKLENSIFIFNQNSLKIVEFSFINNRLKGEISFQVNISNIIFDRIKSFNDRFAKLAITNLSIEDSDIIYDKNSNSFYIYAITKINNEYLYIIRIRIESNYRTSCEIIQDISKLNIEDLQNFLINKIKKAKLFLNKTLNEFYGVISTEDKSFIFFYSSRVAGKGMAYKKASLPIDGVSTNYIGNKSFLNVLFNKNLVIEILFDVRENKLIYKDISNAFYKSVMLKSSFIKPKQNKMNLDNSVLNNNYDNCSEISELYSRPNKSFYQADLVGAQAFSGAYDKSEAGQKVLSILSNKLRKYFEFKLGSKESDLNDIYDINVDIEDLTNFLNTIAYKQQNDEVDFIEKAIEKIILNIIDNESLNINNINMDTKKSEYIIIDYLKERAEKLEIFISFQRDYKIFENFDANKNLYSKAFKYSEKLSAAIKLREQENFLLKNNITILDNNSNTLNSLNAQADAEQKMINISHNFYNDCFEILRCKANSKLNKYSIYLKISKFDEYLVHILDCFQSEKDNLQKKKEDNLFLAFNLVNLWNNIFSEVKKVSYCNELANNQLEIPGSNELNTDYKFTISAKYYENFNNIKSSFWIFEDKESILQKLENLFKFLVQDDKKELISVKNNLSNFSKAIIDFADNLLFFYRMHYNYKDYKDNKKVDYEKKKREIISATINFDYEKSLKLAIKYQSLYSIAYICNLFKCPEKLKEYFNTLHQSVKGGEQIEYMLKVYLILDMKRKISYEKIKQIEIEAEKNLKEYKDNTNKSFNSYDDLPLYFDYFDAFGDYHAQMLNVVAGYPKLRFYYEFFLKSREGVFDRHLNIKITNWEDFLDIDNLINATNKNNNVLSILKMVRYVLNMNLIAYTDEAVNLVSNGNLNNEIDVEIEYKNEKIANDFENYNNFNSQNEKYNKSKQQEIQNKIANLNYLRKKVNFYYMLYCYDETYGYFLENIDKAKNKFLAGAQNVCENIKNLCLKLDSEFSAKVKNGDYNFDKFSVDYFDRIKMLLNLMNEFKDIYAVEECEGLFLVQLNFENLPDEEITKMKNLSLFKLLKDQKAFDPSLISFLGNQIDLKEKLRENFSQENEKIDEFIQYLNLLL